jgi:hypothetical protein
MIKMPPDKDKVAVYCTPLMGTTQIIDHYIDKYPEWLKPNLAPNC